MRTKSLAGLGTLLTVAILLLLVVVPPALGTHDTDPTVEISTPQANNPDYWENLGYGTCEKTDESGTGPYILDDSQNWTLLLFKQANENIYWIDPTPGHGYYDNSEWSHRIVCWNSQTTTTTSIPTTSTTVVESTTTTIVDTTTTTDPATTTTDPGTTTSTTAPSTTTTTVPSTTTSQPTTTSTQPTTTTTDPSTLPFTGPEDIGPTAGAGILLVSLGGLVLLTVRGRLQDD